MKQYLPGIKSIKYLKAENLPGNVIARCMSGTVVPIFNPTTNISFVGVPSCEGSDEDGGVLQNTTLQFSTNDEIPTYEDLAFVVTDVNGSSFLIGQKEGPFPVIEQEKNLGTPSNDSNVTTIKVSFKAKKSLIPCYV